MSKSKTEVLVKGDTGRVDGDYILHGLGDVAVGEFNGRTVAVRANVPGAMFLRDRGGNQPGKFFSTGWKADPGALAASVAALPAEVTHIAFLKDVPAKLRPLVADAETRERRNADELVAAIGLSGAKRLQSNPQAGAPAVEKITTGAGETFTQVPLRCRTQFVRDAGIMVAMISRARVDAALAMRLPDGTVPDYVAFNAGLVARPDAKLAGDAAPADEGE